MGTGCDHGAEVSGVFISRRFGELPPYIFGALEERLRAMEGEGRQVIDLGRADPDQPAPPEVVAALARSAARPEAHGYPPRRGLERLRGAISQWYAQRHHVRLDPDREVLAVLGSKAGIFHLPLATLDPGDVALVPDPAYPAYRMGAYLAGAEVVSLPLRPENGYLPDLAAIPAHVLRRARLIYLNYPHNPTGTTAPLGFLRAVVAFCQRHGLLLCHDFAFGESGYDGYRAPSILEVEGAHSCAVEFMSWSKTFCMSGWRLGAAVGNAEAIAALAQLESHVHSGVFAPVQIAGTVALEDVARTGFLVARNETYRARRDTVLAALRDVGVHCRRPWATPFLWFPCPDGGPALPYATWLLERAGLALAPGSAFGAAGEGFLRLSLTAATRRIDEAAERLRFLGAEGLRHPDRKPAQASAHPLLPAPPPARLVARDVGPATGAQADTLLGSL